MLNTIFLYTSYILLLAVGLISIFKYPKYKDTPLKLFVYYIVFTIVMEIIARLLQVNGGYNVWVYNISINVEILFFIYLYYNYLENKKKKKYVIVSLIVFELFFVLNYLVFFKTWNTYQIYPFSLGSIFVIIAIFLFLLEMFQSEKILHTSKYLIFWISIGLLFYNIVPLPLFIAQHFFINENDYSTGVASLVYNIQYFANIIMYLSFIYGFLWSSKKYTS